jgi:ABC-type transport system involved in multi-copper enzyme maturation permease subunit
MLWEIIRKEFHSNIITARFILGFVICLMLISASTYVAIRNYERRLNDYNVAVREHRDEILNAKVYSELRPRVDRKPNPLSIFNNGMDKRLGNSFRAELSAVPMVYDGEKHGAYNPFLALFPSIDLTFIFQVVLSLLALLFAYDAISGERENGTLKLMMSNSIPRSSVLLGKYLSALLSLIWPIAVSVIVALVTIMFSGKVSLAGGDFVRILLILAASLLYVSLFYLMGLLISTKTSRTATSLMLAMFVWVFLTLIYPNAGGLLADRVIKSTPGGGQFSQIQELWSEFRQERDRYKEKVFPEYTTHGGTGSSSGSMSGSSPDTLFSFLHEFRSMDGEIRPESAVSALNQYYQHVEHLRIRTADSAWQIRKQALDDSYGRKQRLAMRVLRLSPSAVYDNASSILASTDLGGIRHFMDQVREYRNSYIRYLNSREAFSSAEWFNYSNREGDEKLDLSGVPVFHQRAESVASSLSRGTTDVLLLVILNVIFFILSHALFIRQEVR